MWNEVLFDGSSVPVKLWVGCSWGVVFCKVYYISCTFLFLWPISEGILKKLQYAVPVNVMADSVS